MIDSENYDYIILADVIEHITEPDVFLEHLIKHTNEKTKFIISIPNVAFGGLRLALLNGFFDYVDSGLLERTHLRFFTLNSAMYLFKKLGFYFELIASLERSFYRMEFSRDVIRANPLTILNLAIDSNARAYQYLFVLSKNPSSTVIKKYGVNALNILFDAIFVRSIFRKILHYWRKF